MRKICITLATKFSRLFATISIILFFMHICYNFTRAKTKSTRARHGNKMLIYMHNQSNALNISSHVLNSADIAVTEIQGQNEHKDKEHTNEISYSQSNSNIKRDRGLKLTKSTPVGETYTMGFQTTIIQAGKGLNQKENNDKENKDESSHSQSSANIKRGRLVKLTNNKPVGITDIMGLPPIKFDQTYKNPCFLGDKTNPLFNDGFLHCLPYFYLIGVKKSGTTDLFQRISAHPEFRGPGFKEAQWFPRIRMGISFPAFRKKKPFTEAVRKHIDKRSIKFYIALFDRAAANIQKCSSSNKEGVSHHRCITAEATPANLHMHTGWDLLPGNEGLSEPRYTNFHYIKHVTPHAKIIIIFRDPVTRLFSDFLHEMRIRKRRHASSKAIANLFHKQTLALTNAYETCFKRFSMRRCIFNETLSTQLQKKGNILAQSFRAGFYAFYMEELLSVFRREQILAVHMTRYLTKTEQVLTDTFKFLNMSPLSSIEMSKILNLKVANTARSGATMYKETKEMLYKFYMPYNKKMASLMGDNSYLFRQG